MKHFLTVFCILLVSVFYSYGQVGDIKKKSDEHKIYQSTGDSFTGSSSSDNVSSDPCVGACFDACFDIFFSTLMEELIEYNSTLLSNKGINPTVLSLDIKPHFAYDPKDKYLNFLPQIRGNLGLFSLDFRYNALAQFEDYSANLYKTYSLLLLLNPVTFSEFKLTTGAGALFDDFSEQTYTEFYLGFTFRFDDEKYMLNLNGRSSWDYEDGSNTHHEANLKFAYRFIDFNHLFGYVHAGIIYQNYYTAIDFVTIQTGLTFNIH